MSEITVQYERKFSDGQYGSEGLSLSIAVPGDAEGFNEDYLRQWAQQLRKLVLTELSQSAAYQVAATAKRELYLPARRDAVAAGRDDDQPF